MRVLSLNQVLSVAFTATALAQGVFAQTDSNFETTFQVRQRAASLVLREQEIRRIDDSSARCFLRAKIAEFMFENRDEELRETASSMADRCLSEVKNSPDEFSANRRKLWNDYFIRLVDNHDKEAALRLRRLYGDPADNDKDRGSSVPISSNVDMTVSRVLIELRQGRLPNNLHEIFSSFPPSEEVQANRLLAGLADYLLATRGVESTEGIVEIFGRSFLEDSVPQQTRLKYFDFILREGMNGLTAPRQQTSFRSFYDALRIALPSMERYQPELVPRALGLIKAMESKLSGKERNLREAFKAIDESEDKTEQAITEAKNASDKDNARMLWRYAFQIALAERKFDDAIMALFGPEETDETTVASRDASLVSLLLPIVLRQNDIQTAQVVYARVAGVAQKIEASLKISAWYFEKGDFVEGRRFFNESQVMLPRAKADANSIRVAFEAPRAIVELEPALAFESADSAIILLNRLQHPKPEEKVGTEARVDFVEFTLLPSLANVSQAFDKLGQVDWNMSLSLAGQIKSKELLLAAQIAIERHRIYPIPQH